MKKYTALLMKIKIRNKFLRTMGYTESSSSYIDYSERRVTYELETT